MRLRSVSIENFRSYKDRVTVEVGDLTAIIGRNDVGKSTVLEALEIFFNHQLIKLDQKDPCVHNEGKLIEICCVFVELPDQLTIDARSITTLADEHLLNAAGQLEIVKRFDCRTKTPKEEIFARAFHPNDAGVGDLLRLKNADLKARAVETEADLEDVDQRSNSALRAAIRRVVGVGDLSERLIPLAEEDGKKFGINSRKACRSSRFFRPTDRARMMIPKSPTR